MAAPGAWEGREGWRHLALAQQLHGEGREGWRHLAHALQLRGEELQGWQHLTLRLQRYRAGLHDCLYLALSRQVPCTRRVQTPGAGAWGSGGGTSWQDLALVLQVPSTGGDGAAAAPGAGASAAWGTVAGLAAALATLQVPCLGRGCRIGSSWRCMTCHNDGMIN